MRVTKEKAAENRERIVAAAARLFRERGFEGAGVDAVMDHVGLTHGGFYRYFRSKEELAVAALTHGLAASVPQAAALPSLDELIGGYLSPRHRDNPGDGCMVAACGGEIARQGDAARRVLSGHLEAYLGRLAAIIGPDPAAGARPGDHHLRRPRRRHGPRPRRRRPRAVGRNPRRRSRGLRSRPGRRDPGGDLC